MPPPTRKGQTVHSMSVTGGHISVTAEIIINGIEDFSLPVLMQLGSFDMKLGAQHILGICYCIEMVRIEKNSHMLEIRC